MPPKGRNNRRARPIPSNTVMPPEEEGPVRCEHPGCNCEAAPLTALDMLRATDGDLSCISRQQEGEWRQIAVGKFSEWALSQLIQPGDRLLFGDGRRIEVLDRS